jgi:subtilisin family serine protease
MIRVGLIDTGIAAELAPSIAAARRFTNSAGAADGRAHGTAVATVILHHAPQARLLDAQAFGAGTRAEPAGVAAALHWLINQRTRLVNLSLGLRHDREILRSAVAAARAAGLLLIAATPARGAPVYPAAYPGVLRVTGDARCAPGEVSALGGEPADFGACPRDLDGTPSGASLAAAHVTGLIAGGLERTDADVRAILAAALRFHGRERRHC